MTRTTCLLAMGLMMATSAVPRTAEACGGCFTVEGSTESTVVTAHRMAISISQTQSVLWDQIQYSGSPEEFSWVLPVKPGSLLEVGADAWFDVLEAGTSGAVAPVPKQCFSNNGGGSWDDGGRPSSYGSRDGGFGCGSDSVAAPASDEYFGGGGASAGGDPYTQEAEPDPVTVVSQATVGPYETVTLSTEEPGALNEWLTSHGYGIPEEIEPIIDAYVAEGFDFIALRLVPGNDVRQMQPVRVVMPGAQLTLPLRLVAAGTGAQTALTLFVLSEGRYATQNFQNAEILADQLSWDWNSSSSDYSEVRQEALAGNDGRTWLTSYAVQGSLFEPVVDAASPSNTLTYTVPSGESTAMLARAYALSTIGHAGCAAAFEDAAEDNLLIVDDCATGECLPVGEGEVALSEIDCGPEADDLGRALTGMHSGDVWITRLEADLPRAALDQDLQLMAADEQAPVWGRYVAQKSVGDPCPAGSVSGAELGGGRLQRRLPGGLVGIALAALGAAFALRRRRTFLAS